jgi:hypothetical protein
MEIMTRKQATELGEDFYFTGKPCKHGHVEKRRTNNRNCLGCERTKYKKVEKEWKTKQSGYYEEYHRNYREQNRIRLARTSSEHRSKRLKRHVPWANDQLIEEKYTLAKEITEESGVKHVVDHIFPLQGEMVSGLHVETNLQVLPEKDNVSKKNRLEFIPVDIQSMLWGG